ncbi:MAG: UbiD family decarboxylase domain-containing protein, partial [Nitrososphaerales archaeon]
MRPEPDLRSFLERLSVETPASVFAVADEVPLDYTSTALTVALDRQGRAPVVLLSRLAGREGRLAADRLVANLFGSRELMARSIGATPETFLDVLGSALDNLLPAEVLPAGTAAPVHEVVWEGAEADLNRLPVPRHFEQDAGPYITAGMTAARDPDTGVGNLA